MYNSDNKPYIRILHPIVSAKSLYRCGMGLWEEYLLSLVNWHEYHLNRLDRIEENYRCYGGVGRMLLMAYKRTKRDII